MFKKLLKSIIISSIILCGCAVGPQLSPMQIRQITTKLINGSYEDTYRGSLTVLQDQGYIIKNTDMATGLIVANVDRAADAGSQFAQALLLGYVADKGSEVELSCMINKLSNSNTEIRLNIQEANYGQSSRWSGSSKQNVKQIYDPELYQKIFNEIEMEVKRRQAIMGMSNKNVAASSQGAVIPSETNDINFDSSFNSLVEQDTNTYYRIIKVVQGYCLIKITDPSKFQLGETYDILRGNASNYSTIGKGKVARIKGDNVAFQIINGTVKVNDKIKSTR